MQYRGVSLSLVVTTMLTILGCDGGSSNSTPDTTTPEEVSALAPQAGTQGYLFYGHADHKQLGSVKNVRIVDPKNPENVIVERESLDVRYPVLSTTVDEYNATTKRYKNLHVSKLNYVSEGKAYTVDMQKTTPIQSMQDDETICDCATSLRATTPAEVRNSSATNLTAAGRSLAYEDISYLGVKQILIAKENAKQVLITCDMGATDAAINFEGKEFLSLSYPSYGADVNGVIVYDSLVKKVQNCSMDMMACTDILDAQSAPKFLGDIGGTTLSALSISNNYYTIDKADNSYKALVVPASHAPIRFSASNAYFNGDTIYILENGNIFSLNAINGVYKQISSNGYATRVRAFTSDMVIFGGDSEMYAVMKDGSSKGKEIEISTTTKTKGQKYPFDMGIGDTYLFNLYSVDTQSADTTYRACTLKSGNITCKDNSFWGPVVAAQNGEMHFDATFQYTPYAYIRIDDTDNFGGGTVSVVDPKNPLGAGFAVGEVAKYNFQTFMNGRYSDTLIDSDGTVVIYAKNDVNYRSDAFILNLREANSLKNISNDPDPTYEEINGGRSHCHGRYCSVCHSFSGGKINIDRAGKNAAVGYNIRYDFENGESMLAKIRKGIGENFNAPMKELAGKNFTANVVDENNTVVNRSNEFSHRGVEYYNCNFCHRKDDLRHDAPSVISIEASQ